MTASFNFDSKAVMWRGILKALAQMADDPEYDPTLLNYLTHKAVVAKVMGDDPMEFMRTMF